VPQEILFSDIIARGTTHIHHCSSKEYLAISLTNRVTAYVFEAASRLDDLLLHPFQRGTYPDREFSSPMSRTLHCMLLILNGLVDQEIRHTGQDMEHMMPKRGQYIQMQKQCTQVGCTDLSLLKKSSGPPPVSGNQLA
jgi:hypothetical protein